MRQTRVPPRGPGGRRGGACGSGAGAWAAAPRRVVVWETEPRDSNGTVDVSMGVSELTRNAVDVLPAGELERKLARGRPLRIKLGIDPTAPDIHLGNAVPLQKMAAFQREGHVGVLILGDYTARIGDPSGRSKERPILPDEVLDANARSFADQAFKILDPERTEVRYNGEWLAKLSYAEIVRIT